MRPALEDSSSMENFQIAPSVFLLLHAEIVDYNLRGAGARFYDPPEDAKVDQQEPSSSDPIANKSDQADGSSTVVVAAKRKRLEALGQAVGLRLAEFHAHQREMPDQDLDIVKFICKDFWEAIFRKQIDVLRTNHRGLFVLTDNNFPWLASVASTSSHAGKPEEYVVFPCGIICGALTRLGLRCRVTADLFPTSPGYRCSFNVQLVQSR